MRALFLNGSVGSGKTTTAEALGGLLRQKGISHAIVDLDGLRKAWPAPTGDVFNNELELQNLAAVSRNFDDVGVDWLLLSGVIETRAMRPRYAEAVGCDLTICRLVVPVDQLETRLRGRHEPGETRDWHLRRAGELDRILDAAGVDDLLVDVGADAPEQVAARVLSALEEERRDG